MGILATLAAATAPRPSDSLIRGIASEIIAFVGGQPADAVLKQRWPRDDVAKSFLKTRAAVVPTSMANTALSTTATGDFLLSIGPKSALSELLNQGLMLDFGRSQSISVPNIISAATFASPVAEGVPIPVYQANTGPSTLLTLQTLKGICTFTRELAEHSNFEVMVRQVLEESIGLSADALAFTASAGGLLNGVAAGSESADSDKTAAMFEDLATLLSSVAPVAGNFSVAIVTSPVQATKLKLRLLTARDPGFTVLASSAVSDGTIIAIAANALVAATSPTPTFDVSDKATVVLDDGTPGQLVVGASTASGPARNLWQTDSVGLKIRFGVSWALRSASGIAWLQNVVW